MKPIASSSSSSSCTCTHAPNRQRAQRYQQTNMITNRCNESRRERTIITNLLTMIVVSSICSSMVTSFSIQPSSVAYPSYSSMRIRTNAVKNEKRYKDSLIVNEGLWIRSGGIPCHHRRTTACHSSTVDSSEWKSRSQRRSEWKSNRDQQQQQPARKKKKKYERKRPKTRSEQEFDQMRRSRQAEYEQLMKDTNTVRNSNKSNSKSNQLWMFETLFPEPVLDEDSINRDLYEVSERDARTTKYMNPDSNAGVGAGGDSAKGTNAVVANWAANAGGDSAKNKDAEVGTAIFSSQTLSPTKDVPKSGVSIFAPPILESEPQLTPEPQSNITFTSTTNNTLTTNNNNTNLKINRPLTRMVEDRLYGFRRAQTGEFEYATSLIGDGAVQFRDGVRLGNPLKVNTDRLTHFAKKELAAGRLEEAEEMYESALEIDPRDGRSYLGLSRVAQRRRDFRHAKDCLVAGIENSFNPAELDKATGNSVYDLGANPFLLQALGCLEEKMGNLAAAESSFIAATKSRPSHAAAWISLAQLRTRKLRQGPKAGRFCYQTAERELDRAGKPESSHVYTAWAALEWKAGDIRTARKLFKSALKVDPRCSAAWLQLGVMEADREDWDEAKTCFETVLKFDRRNTRVMQAYAIMESKRPDGNSRNVIGLFEKALRANSRDGGVLQAYALYVVKLGDIYAARELLRKGTIVNKRHAPIWQAWGVLETRHGNPEDARDIFQQGIWACAQSSGGQSGGRRCARLWQAWGVLESQEEDYDAARRCFSRALDADSWNVAAVTAWTVMEKNLGNYKDARLIYERALKQFSTPTDEKLILWRAYELMESEAGNLQKAQSVYQRSMGDAIAIQDEFITDLSSKILKSDSKSSSSGKKTLDDGNEVEVIRWDKKPTFGENDVWLNDGSIEGKVPPSTMNKTKRQ